MSDAPGTRRPWGRRLASSAAWFGFAVAMSVIFGLVADELLGINYRWGIGLGIAVATVITDSRRQRHTK